MPRLLVVVPAGAAPRLQPGPGHLVVGEEDLTKCHSTAEVRTAAGSLYVTISPVAPSLSKPGYGPPLGAEGVRAAAATAGSMPVFALGGVTVDNARSFLDAGAHGIAIMGPVLRASEPESVVAAYLEVLR